MRDTSEKDHARMRETHREQTSGRFGPQMRGEATGGTDALSPHGSERPLEGGKTHPEDNTIVTTSPNEGEDDRVVLYRPHRKPPDKVTFASLTSFDICPAQHAYEQIDQAPPDPDADTAKRDVGFGVHKALEQMAESKSDDPEDVVEKLARSKGLEEHSDKIAEVVAAAVEWDAASPRRQGVIDTRRKLSTTVGDEKIHVSETVDSVSRDPDGTLVIEDYKTGRPPAKLLDGDTWMEPDTRKVALHAELMAEQGEHVGRARLLYPRDRRVVEVDLDSESGKSRRASARAFLKGATRQVVKAYRTGEFEARPSKGKCRRCPFADRCPASKA